MRSSVRQAASHSWISLTSSTIVTLGSARSLGVRVAIATKRKCFAAVMRCVETKWLNEPTIYLKCWLWNQNGWRTWVGKGIHATLQSKSNTNKASRSSQMKKTSRECDERVFDCRFSIHDLRLSFFNVRVSTFQCSSFEFRCSIYSIFEFRCSIRKASRNRKLIEFMCLLSVYLHYMLQLVYFHHLACQIYSISTSSATPTATSTLLFYFYIAACGDRSSCPRRCSTYIMLLVTTVPPARALY